MYSKYVTTFMIQGKASVLRHKFVFVALFVVSLSYCTSQNDCFAVTYRLEGVGTLSGTPPFGVPGELVTVGIDLDSDQLVYVPVANPSFHLFDPTQTIPISLVGETSGAFPNVDPLVDIVALELTADEGVVDQVGISNGTSSSVTSVFKSFCNTDDCFDGDVRPFTPTEMFELLDESVNDTANWSTSFANIFTGGAQDIVLLNDVSWTFTEPPTSTQTINLTPTFDVQLTPSDTLIIEEGAATLTIDGGSGAFFPRKDILIEFPLDQIPADAEIVSASLSLDGSSSQGSVQIIVDGYAGDGLAATNDASATTTTLATTDPLNSNSDIAISLDAEFIRAMLDSASHLGLRLSSLNSGPFLSVFASESASGTPPTLSIEYIGEAIGGDGDYDGDGDVDGGDFLKWQLGESTTPNSPGDLAAWEANYGSGIGTNVRSTSTAVPEPASLAIISLSLVVATLARRSRS